VSPHVPISVIILRWLHKCILSLLNWLTWIHIRKVNVNIVVRFGYVSCNSLMTCWRLDVKRFKITMLKHKKWPKLNKSDNLECTWNDLGVHLMVDYVVVVRWCYMSLEVCSDMCCCCCSRTVLLQLEDSRYEYEHSHAKQPCSAQGSHPLKNNGSESQSGWECTQPESERWRRPTSNLNYVQSSHRKTNPSSCQRGGPFSKCISDFGKKNIVTGPGRARNQEWLCRQHLAENYCSA
jgi:hypothetical protein